MLLTPPIANKVERVSGGRSDVDLWSIKWLKSSQNQAGLSVTWVVVVMFASLRGFVPVRNRYALCSRRQEV